MPELPEVELFRQLLLPLVSKNERNTLTIDRVGENPRIRWHDELGGVESVRDGFFCTDILRKGKQLCLVLKGRKGGTILSRYLYLHMGMTGRIRLPGRAENWGAKQSDGTVVKTDLQSEESIGDESLPPKYTYLVFSSVSDTSATLYTTYFCDPRKFGSCYLTDSSTDLETLAPDAYTCDDPTIIEQHILPALMNQRVGIKSILLDQKRAVSGVGNWVADEVLYQCHCHPDQSRLTPEEASTLWQTLQSIVSVAVYALTVDNTHYPVTWLFGYRWTKKKATQDAQGRAVTFLQSGGRTSAIVPSIQKLSARKYLVPKASRVATSSLSTVNASPAKQTKTASVSVIKDESSPRKRLKAHHTTSPTTVVDVLLRRKSPRVKHQ